MDGPPGAPTLLVLHGLEGCSEREYVRGLLGGGRARGWRGAALNFRSCSGPLNRAPRLYHSGETGDLDWVVRQLVKRDPSAALLIVGVSLGGNVLLKWLGEQATRAPDQLQAAVAISTPFDLGAAADRMSRGLGRLYSRYFLRTLKAKALAKARQYPGVLDPDAVRRARTWRDYDQAATAPLHGFASAEEYWRESSSIAYLDEVRRPTLLLNALDDPFIPSSSLPGEAARRSESLRPEFTVKGGHVGFVSGAAPWRASYWAERRAVEYLSHFVPTIRPLDA